MPDNAAIYASTKVISVEKLRTLAPGMTVSAKQRLLGGVSQLTVRSADYILILNVMPAKDIPAHIAGFLAYLPHLRQHHTDDEMAELADRLRNTRQVLGCVVEPGFDAEDDCRRLIDAVARECDGLIFLDSSVFDTETGEKWLNPELQRLETEVAMVRKRRSEALLQQEGVPYLEHLPRIETEVTMRRRTVEEVAWRAMAVGLAAVKGEGLEQPRVLDVLARYHLDPHLTAAERRFLLDANPSEQDRTDFTWKYECCWVLLWALGYVEHLGRPDHLCDVPSAVRMMVDRTPQQFIADARRREASQIFDAADLAFRYHWAVTEARLKQTPPPAGLEPGVVYERHYALNWLIGYADDWDHVSTNT